MIPPHRIDIELANLFWGLIDCLAGDQSSRSIESIAASMRRPDSAVVVGLSVRSLYDAFLAAQDWPAGSEVALSALTIADMAKITQAHGFVPVGVDLDPLSLSITPQTLASVMTERTRAVVVAQLFGNRAPLQEIAQVTRARGSLLIEDGAQAFAGDDYVGDAATDVTLFSFGPIKRLTALGGGIALFRDKSLAAAVQPIISSQPRQLRRDHSQRLVKFALLRAAAEPFLYTTLLGLLSLLGQDPHELLHRWTRSFPGTDWLDRIRSLPSAPLLRLLARRLRQDYREANRRRWETVAKVTQGYERLFPGVTLPHHAHWIFPMDLREAEEFSGLPREQIRQSLRAIGLDAAPKTTSLSLVPPRSCGATPVSERLLRDLLFLPSPDLWPERTIVRMRNLLESWSQQKPARD